jgi:heme oxygenase
MVAVSSVVRRSGPPSALRVLRQRTSAAHARLDARLSGDEHRVTDEASYARLLGVLTALHLTTERPLHAWVAGTPWVSAALAGVALPDRADLLAADLADLGVPAVDSADGPAPTYDDAQGLAVLYLLAGSSKGARVLLKGLPDHVAPGARRGLTDAASRDSALLWGAVVDVLGEPLTEAHPTTHLELAAAAGDHAVAVFGALQTRAASRAEVVAS